MTEFTHKVDFIVIVSVTNANPNGDPLNGNRPREDYEGFGEISDVCIKRKIRNRLQDMGQEIFVQSDDRRKDGFDSLAARAEGCDELKAELDKKLKANFSQCRKIACAKWIDVRSFGQVFAFGKEKNGKRENSNDENGKKKGVSIGIRGPVSIHQALSVSPVDIISMQITKSVQGESKSDTMGMKHRVAFGLYVIKGSINCQLAEQTGFSEEDADLMKEALRTLFDNDLSSARPEGSMEVCRLYWWKHEEKMPAVSTAQVHRSVKITHKEGENHVFPSCAFPVHRSVKITHKEGVESPKSVEDYEFELENPDGCVEPEIQIIH